MFKRKHVLFIFIFIAIVIVVVLGRHYEKSGALSNLVLSLPLSAKAYAIARDHYVNIVRNEDPRAALTALREDIKTNDALARSCHPIVHEIGRAAYEKYKDFGTAAQYQDGLCLSGYLHGVIEGYFSGATNKVSEIKNVCEQYSSGSFLKAQCYHGTGHGFMFLSANNLPRSLSFCDLYGDTFDRFNCINGAFMENANADKIDHPSKFLSDNDPAYPCDVLDARYKKTCYLNAPLRFLNLHHNEYVNVLAWCKSIEAPYQLSCAQGVGYEVAQENLNNPESVESVCASGSLAQREPCITGMAIIYVLQFESIDATNTFCNTLHDTTNQQSCHNAVKEYSALFGTS